MPKFSIFGGACWAFLAVSPAAASAPAAKRLFLRFLSLCMALLNKFRLLALRFFASTTTMASLTGGCCCFCGRADENKRNDDDILLVTIIFLLHTGEEPTQMPDEFGRRMIRELHRLLDARVLREGLDEGKLSSLPAIVAGVIAMSWSLKGDERDAMLAVSRKGGADAGLRNFISA